MDRTSEAFSRGIAEAIANWELHLREAGDSTSGRLHRERYAEQALALRLQELERQATFGLAAYLVLSDLLMNVRTNGGMTVDIIENTFAELSDYFRTVSPDGANAVVRLVDGMRWGDPIL